MNKSIPAFVIGLIFSIIGAICAYLFWMVFVLIGAFTGGNLGAALTVLPMVNLASFAISFVGCFFCFRKAKVGGIIMLSASILSLACFLVISILLKSFNIIQILFWLPTVLVMVAGMLGIKASRKTITATNPPELTAKEQ